MIFGGRMQDLAQAEPLRSNEEISPAACFVDLFNRRRADGTTTIQIIEKHGNGGGVKMSQSRGGRRDSTDIGLPIQQNIDGLCYVL